MKFKLGLTLALLVMFNFSTSNAEPIDNELAILASEQSKEEKNVKPAPEPTKSAEKTKKEIEAEKKRLRDEKRTEEKRIKEEQEAARKQIEEGKKEKININSNRNLRNTSAEVSGEKKNLEIPTTSNESDTSTNEVEENQVVKVEKSQPTKTDESSADMPNPIIPYQTYEELAKAVNFNPLYMPKKSGYTVNQFSSINDKVADIRYGRRWEPEVLLIVRTYKRAPDEELQDISGIHGVKWRVDESTGSTIYVTKINDTDHAAAWAVGDYTFAAYVKNLSFAAFYALVVEELVDLSKHYYII